MEETVRKPVQKRAILKKEKIIQAGFDLICQKGYYHTNTREIADKAGVSTGIIYQYFKDKHDIFMEGLSIYGEEIFFPILKIDFSNLSFDSFENILRQFILEDIQDHKLSKIAHEEITAMIHSDSDVANYFYQKELEVTEELRQIFLSHHFSDDDLFEKIHVMLSFIDSLCHEIIYHQHENMNYDKMTDIVVKAIIGLFPGIKKKNITSI